MKQILTVILLVMIILNGKCQTLDQDYITGIPTTTSFGGHPLGQDNDQGQSFTPYITGNLCQLKVLGNIDDMFMTCNPNDSVGLVIEVHNGDGFAGSVLGVSDTLYSGVISNSILAFNFSTAIPISSGSAYTWELKRVSESCQDLSVSLEAEFNGSYAGGVAYNNGSPAGSGQDILFQSITCEEQITGVDTRTECNSYTWIDGNNYISSNNTATFNIVGGAANGCDSLVTLDLTIINSATGTDTRTECNSYTWIDGNTYIASNNSATFNIVGGAANGCDSLVTLDLTINNVSDLTTSTSGVNITANNTGVNYQWLDCDNNYSLIASETSQSFTATANGNYAVQLTENGCLDTSACVNISTVGVIENNFGNSLSVYPNPTSGNFSIDLGDSYDKSVISITDVTGRLRESKTITQSEILNLSINESAGIYFITIQAGDKKAVIRLVKE
ncbi:MAG: T9SS type A sorting domain-containing protein [Crocinitomicaceae bacterium]|nr:T9SS type A sorting domain-containing protein [Crocinitomicaceae bacterium]